MLKAFVLVHKSFFFIHLATIQTLYIIRETKISELSEFKFYTISKRIKTIIRQMKISEMWQSFPFVFSHSSKNFTTPPQQKNYPTLHEMLGSSPSPPAKPS